ncbi:MAG TPA: M14 family metallopeptidase [bacterium]|nr:M14 family metallopeptidase [bacterium]
MLKVLEEIPAGLLELKSDQLGQALDGPTLIHLAGRRPEPLFVSVLLHGNETTGWNALRGLLAAHGAEPLPRALSFFIGNVAAAAKGVRRLEDQPDFNRIWLAGTSPEHEMTRRVLEELRQRRAFASVDIHNNTGVNPHYACVNRLDHRFFHLATLFQRTVVYFTRPEGVQTSAFADLCPSVTLECGQVGSLAGLSHVRDYLNACLHLAEIPAHPIHPQDIDLYHTVAVVKVPDEVSFGFGAEEGDLRLPEDLERRNFTELEPGFLLAKRRLGSDARLVVADESGREVGDRYLEENDGELRTRLKMTPSMFTLDKTIIRQDCLGYFMERMGLPPA